MAVVTAVAAADDWPASYEAGGVVRARNVAVLSSRVVAPVTAVHVVAGDRVRRGQRLVSLDGRELDAHAARAAASRTGAASSLEAARAERRATQAALVLARATHERISGLKEKRSATAQEFDEADSALAAAEARAAAAEARVVEAEQGVTAAGASVDAATASASYAELVAPFDGRVVTRHVDPGALAAPGAPLVTLEDTRGFRFEASIDESHAQLAAVGAPVEIQLDHTAGAWQPARISETGAVDPSRHSVLVKADVAEDAALRSGQFGRMRLRGPSRRALTIPATALVKRGQLTFVFVVDGEGRARLRMVSAGETRGDRVEVLAGIGDGETIVTAPPATLMDGAPTTAGARGAGAVK
ncbi:MAG: efflux RND transporter periplasmic adaptor subunit [Acidobacteria bacterium]|nr:efflux RND transporter periplasmic adaptor subunit [Acidobacteriota bacterium]